MSNPVKNTQHIAPKYNLDGFTCPHCNTRSQHTWYTIRGIEEKELAKAVKDYPNLIEAIPHEEEPGRLYLNKIDKTIVDMSIPLKRISISECTVCHDYTIWIDTKIKYPQKSNAPPPCDNMPHDIKTDYTEARKIAGLSPRGAAALLRLSLEKLVQQLTGKNDIHLYNNINCLLEKYPYLKSIEEHFHTARIIGNDAVHPGTLDLKDNNDTADLLFKLINFIFEYTIDMTKKMNAIKKANN